MEKLATFTIYIRELLSKGMPLGVQSFVEGGGRRWFMGQAQNIHSCPAQLGLGCGCELRHPFVILAKLQAIVLTVVGPIGFDL